MTARSRRLRLRLVELTLVTALAVGFSAARSVLYFIAAADTPGRLSAQKTQLLTSFTPANPNVDLGLQLVSLMSLAAPALLAYYLIAAGGEPLRVIGVRRDGLGRAAAIGAGFAATLGGLGLLVYLVAHRLGLALTVVPSTLASHWWTYPVLILAAGANALLEESVLSGYLLHRLDQLGVGPRAALSLTAALRGLYHLYQGLAGLVGNAVLGAVFGWYYRRRRTIMPQLIAHTLMDIVALAGYSALVGHLHWLPR